MPFDKLVSVITPAHNAASVIERVAESVGRQTVRVLEHIVIDDGSDDDTPAVLGELKSRYPHLRTISQPRRGAAVARNAGIKIARGRYIAFLDSDDEWLPDKLERQVIFMEEQNVLFSYGDYQRVDGHSGDSIKVIDTPKRLTHGDFLKGCPIGCLTAAFNQEVLGKHYMPQVRRGHDWGLWLQLTRNNVVALRYPGVAAVYHDNRGSLSKDKLRKARDVYTIYRQQEGFGRLRSLSFLTRHILSKLIGLKTVRR